jgi:hypothetical protein
VEVTGPLEIPLRRRTLADGLHHLAAQLRDGADPQLIAVTLDFAALQLEQDAMPGTRRDVVSEACQFGRHGDCNGWRTPVPPGTPLIKIKRDPCECPMHHSGGALCWGDIRRVEVRP